MSKRILVVDDEPSIVVLLQYNLQQAGFLVTVAHDGEQALQIASTKPFDFIILDLMLPKIEGMEVCRSLRQAKIMTPILMLTAKSQEQDKILGLDFGADDYMTKPFSPREVIARIHAILRRTEHTAHSQEKQNRISIGQLEILPHNYEVYFDKQKLELTPKEFELLVYLAKNKDIVVSREKLMDAVWHYDFVGDTRMVDVHISNLRDKIEIDSKKPKYIKTIRGLGYKFEEPHDE